MATSGQDDSPVDGHGTGVPYAFLRWPRSSCTSASHHHRRCRQRSVDDDVHGGASVPEHGDNACQRGGEALASDQGAFHPKHKRDVQRRTLGISTRRGIQHPVWVQRVATVAGVMWFHLYQRCHGRGSSHDGG